MAEHRITLIEPIASRTSLLARRVGRLFVRDALQLSNVAFLALAAATFVASTIVFFLNLAHETEMDRALAASGVAAEARIHTAQADASEALFRAVALESENLQTKERTAMLVREAQAAQAQATPAPADPADAPFAVPRAGQAFAERTLSNEQRARMIAELIQHPGQVTIVNGVGPDAERYAAALRVLFGVSGWTVESGVVVEPKAPSAPLSLVVGASAPDMAIRRAFEAAGVVVRDRPRSLVDRPSTIYVGA